eukprot:COSAG01_NODE_6982_length_3405_cov_2.719601_5_plen_98_part_00
MLKSVQRLAYGLPVISRGPTLVSSVYSVDAGKLVVTFSNSTLKVGPGIFVGGGSCGKGGPGDNAFLSKVVKHGGKPAGLSYTITGAKVRALAMRAWM